MFIGLLLALALQLPRAVTLERRLTLMGTDLALSVEAADRSTALRASEAAVRAIEETELRLSTWRPDSELSRLNARPAGQPVALSAELYRELVAARRCWHASGGAFDPGIGALIEAWGLRQGGRIPTAGQLRQARAASRLEHLVLRADGTAVRRHAGLRLEEGAFGKGAALDRAVAALAAAGGVRRAHLDLGGQVAVFGAATDWVVPVADPGQRARAVLALQIDRGSLATSGNSERALGHQGRRLGHILDPLTGQPAPDFGSLTVWAADGLTADCLSTALYVMGPEQALRWAAAHPGVEVVVLEAAGSRTRARVTPGLSSRVAVLSPGCELAQGLPAVR